MSFDQCLMTCAEQGPSECFAINYDFLDNSCELFNGPEIRDGHIRYEQNYGTVTAINLEFTYRNEEDESWRFVVENGTDLEFGSSWNTDIGNGDSCPKLDQVGHGNFFNPSCLQAKLLGCDETSSGCQECYYPEKLDYEHLSHLPICANSMVKLQAKLDEAKLRCTSECLEKELCVRFGIHKLTFECNLLENNDTEEDWVYFFLLYPPSSSLLYNFDWAFETELVKVDDSSPHTPLTAQSLDSCLKECQKNIRCRKVQFRDGQCISTGWPHIASVQNSNNTDDMVFFKKNLVGSVASAFVRNPGVRIEEAAKSLEIIDNIPLESCLKNCYNNPDCQYAQAINVIGSSQVHCSLYGSATKSNPLNIYNAEDGELFTRSLVKLDLAIWSNVSLFQDSEFLDCYRRPHQGALQSEVAYNGSAELYPISSNSIDDNSNTSLIRTKRGLFGDIWNGLKKIAKTIYEAGKDVVEEVVDTAEGVFKAGGKLLKGDLKGALEELGDIPLIKDIGETAKNLVTLGEGIVTGDLDKIKEGALGALISVPIDKIIPGAGKVGKIAIDKVQDKLKKIKKRAKRSAEKAKEKFKKNKTKKKRQQEEEREETK